MAKASEIPLDDLTLPIVLAQVKATTKGGAQAVVTLSLDEHGKLVVIAETPPPTPTPGPQT